MPRSTRAAFTGNAPVPVYTYCIYELRLSEDMAYRHARAAKVVRRWPALLDRLAAGELHLAGLLLLGPHLTVENQVEVLLRAKHRSKREIEKLVRWLDPLPDVPAKVEPPGPSCWCGPVRTGTWQNFVSSFNPVRDLPDGQRPRDWLHPDEEYVTLLSRAQDLLSHAVPTRSIEEVHLRAMRALVAELEKRRYAVADNPSARVPAASETPTASERPKASEQSKASDAAAARDPRQRGRHIPARRDLRPCVVAGEQ